MILFIFYLLSLIFAPATYATEEFTVSQSINFSVNPDKSASVSQTVNLVNNFSQIYPKEYSLTLSGTNVSLTTPKITSDYEITRLDQLNNQSDIHLNLLRPGIGKDQATNFTLNYNLKDFVISKGKTSEISIPTYKNSLLPASITATIKVPANLGELSYSSVPIINNHNLGDTTELSLNLTSVDRKIILVFGNHQLVDFQLKYFLKNDSEVATTTEIALPPDTDNQTVIIDNISPPPENVTIDQDGNWLALYKVPANQQVVVDVKGQSKIFPTRQTAQIIDASKYLSDQRYWPVSDPQIKAVSNNFSTPRQAYNYTVKNLKYDYSQINNSSRKGALFALHNPQNSICTEFSDLFVTLCRSLGVPAREIEGYALSNNQKVKPTNPNSDILHSWAQYYDSTTKTWNSVDPTWENTTNGIDYFNDLDLNHLAFVIHGLSSDYPAPPGAYKAGNDVKTVQVDFATEEVPTTADKPKLTLNGDQITLINTNNHSLNNLRLENKKSSWSKTVASVPPFGKVSLNYPQPNFFENAIPGNNSLAFQITSNETPGGQQIVLQNNSHFLDLTIIIAVLIVGLCTGGIIITTQKSK